MSRTIRIGTRKSRLAVIQTQIVIDRMKEKYPDLEFEMVMKQTKGDTILDQPLISFGGKGVFVSEFEDALLKGEIDFAVHSAKDLPMELAEGLFLAGIPEREDPRDVLVTMAPQQLWESGGGQEKTKVVIGTSSLRRGLQITELGQTLFPGKEVVCENLRGNVQTRLKKLEECQYDGIILAAAGLKRLGLLEEKKYHYHYFDCRQMIPAGGQGILAVEGRIGNPVNELAEAITEKTAEKCLKAERQFLKQMNAGCHEPIGVYARERDGELRMEAIYQSGDMLRRAEVSGQWEQAELLAGRLAEKLKGRTDGEQ